MKSKLNPQHPLVSNSQKIKEDGIVIMHNVTMLPTGSASFVSPDYVICIGHRGKMELIYDDLPDISAPRVFAIIFPNHKIKCINCTDDFLASLIAVDAKMIDEPMLQIIRQFRYRYESQPGVTLGKPEYKTLMHIVELMHETARTNIPDKRTLMIRQLDCFLRMLNHYRHNMLNDESSTKRFSTQFLSAINEHYREHRDVLFYANLACLTPKYFTTVIRKETGHTPSYWISTTVSAKAKMLLHTRPDLSIQAIADLLGFDDQNTFSRYFKHATGMSPSAFRENK